MAIVAPSAESVAKLRADLVHDIVMRRHSLLCITPPAPAHDLRVLRELGVSHRSIEIDPPGLRLVADWKAVRALVDLFRDWQPDLVMGFGLRPMISAAIAGRRARVKRVVSLCNGLPKEDIAAFAARRLAHALRASDAVIFHNEDDRRRLVRLGLLPANVRTAVVAGAGVNLIRHASQSLPSSGAGVVFLMISRLDRSRGVCDYARAAHALDARMPGSRFLLAGMTGSGPGAVSERELEDMGAPVERLGPIEDVRKALAECHVFVYPSHAEGMPRTVLEALAAGRPVITTNVPGCRDTIDDKVSGCLVPSEDPEALAAAMASFVRRPDLIEPAARAARLKAERRFDVRDVNRKVIEILELT
jgi:glycosyltransferase involved in cell wall biosynthesis